MDSKQEMISRLEEAQDMMREALGILKDVAHASDSRMADAYIIPHLETLIDDEHDWLSSDYNVGQWIDELRDTDDEDFDTDEDLDEPDEIVTPVAIPEPVDPATFPHSQEFAGHLRKLYCEGGYYINAIKDYRIEYGVGLKDAKVAVDYIFSQK